MARHLFAALERRLLEQGVAVRHVRRYIGELRMHLDEIVEEEVRSGLSRDEAEILGLRRPGSEKVLADAMLARPELRALSARYPLLAFGLGPIAALALIVACVLFVEVGIVFAAPDFGAAVFWRTAFDALNAFAVYGAPIIVAALLIAGGLRQRIPNGWIALGLGVICVVGSFHHIGIAWSPSPDMPSELSLSFELAPPFPQDLIVSGGIRMALNAVLMLGVWALARNFSRPYVQATG